MSRMEPLLEVRALDPLRGRRTRVTWHDHAFSLEGDNHVAHGGASAGPDGFDLVAAALGQCLLNTLLAKAQRDRKVVREARAIVSTKTRLRGGGAAPHLSVLKVDIYLEGDLEEADRQSLEDWAREKCGVRATLMQPPRIEERVHLDGGQDA